MQILQTNVQTSINAALSVMAFLKRTGVITVSTGPLHHQGGGGRGLFAFRIPPGVGAQDGTVTCREACQWLNKHILWEGRETMPPQHDCSQVMQPGSASILFAWC
jgi:hypothetical protein